MVLNY